MKRNMEEREIKGYKNGRTGLSKLSYMNKGEGGRKEGRERGMMTGLTNKRDGKAIREKERKMKI
jgi:hypothetical protein